MVQDALVVRQQVRVTRVANDDVPPEGGTIQPPGFTEWASTANHYEYQAHFINASKGWNVISSDLTTHEDCVMLQNRVWVPASLEQEIAPILHLGHKCLDRMFKVASNLCYWMEMKETLTDLVTECRFCQEYTNLQVAMDKQPSLEPSYPGEMISIDVG